MTAPPNGHWFRFSLRTMFIVVTLLGTWLGWQLKIVRDRRDELAKLAKGDGWFITEAEYQQTPSRPPADPTAYRMPFWRAWLGDQPIAQIGFEKSASQQQRERVKALFGEAYVSDQ